MKQTQAVKARSGGAVATALALAANSDRIGFIIQNLGTPTLFVKFGSTATSSSFDYVLSASTTANDGTGGVLQMLGETVYMGAIYVAVASGTASYTAFDL